MRLPRSPGGVKSAVRFAVPGADTRAIGSTAGWQAQAITHNRAGRGPGCSGSRRDPPRQLGEGPASPRLCVLALVGYFAFPTYPTYDSFYALLWGRDLLHMHLPDFSVYRGPTEHPLAIAFGALLDLRPGWRAPDGPRLDRLLRGTRGGRLPAGRLCFGPVVGLFAGLLVLSRFFVENLAAQGYLDISYVALVVWATALEIERPRRGPAVVPAMWRPPGCCAPTLGS